MAYRSVNYGDMTLPMKKLILTVVFLVLAGTAVVHYYPEQTELLFQGTPLKELVSMSKPLYQWKDKQGEWHIVDMPPHH